MLIIYDDLTKQAVAYRQMSLTLRRPPGREAYPGDIFYLHSRLLERAVKMSDENGAGSMTALPIIETQAGDVLRYIPTNVISITDGQIYLQTDLFFQGQRPAVNVGISVSRVGGSAQTKAYEVRCRYTAPRPCRLSRAAGIYAVRFRPGQGYAGSAEPRRSMTELLKQGRYIPMSFDDQAIAIYAGGKGYLDDIPVADVVRFRASCIEYLHASKPAVVESVKTDAKKFTDERS